MRVCVRQRTQTHRTVLRGLHDEPGNKHHSDPGINGTRIIIIIILHSGVQRYIYSVHANAPIVRVTQHTYLNIFFIVRDFFFLFHQTSRDVYSVGAYSGFVLIVIVFLITDYLRYKPVLVLDGMCGILAYCSIIGHPSLLRMQVNNLL